MDTERVLELLEICDRTRNYPTLKVIFDEAWRELVEIEAGLKEHNEKAKAVKETPKEAKHG